TRETVQRNQRWTVDRAETMDVERHAGMLRGIGAPTLRRRPGREAGKWRKRAAGTRGNGTTPAGGGGGGRQGLGSGGVSGTATGPRGGRKNRRESMQWCVRTGIAVVRAKHARFLGTSRGPKAPNNRIWRASGSIFLAGSGTGATQCYQPAHRARRPK